MSTTFTRASFVRDAAAKKSTDPEDAGSSPAGTARSLISIQLGKARVEEHRVWAAEVRGRSTLPRPTVRTDDLKVDEGYQRPDDCRACPTFGGCGGLTDTIGSAIDPGQSALGQKGGPLKQSIVSGLACDCGSVFCD